MVGSCLCEKLFLEEKRSQGSSLETAVQHTVDLMERVVRGDAWQQCAGLVDGVWGLHGEESCNRRRDRRSLTT